MTKRELAEAMLKGVNAPGVTESYYHYIGVSKDSFPEEARPDAMCAVCALGAAVVGVYGDYKEALSAWLQAWSRSDGEHEAFSNLLDIPVAQVIEVESRHLRGDSIKQIAAWLKS